MSRYQVLSQSDASEMYDEILDQDGPVTVAGIQFDPSRILREMDPIAYDVGFSDFVSSLEEDGVYVEGLTEDEDDGQPDEAQEWADFDADC